MDLNNVINKMGRALALGGVMDGFAEGLTTRDAGPGTAWHFVSIDTHVIGMVIRGATGRPVADLLAEKIIQPIEGHGYHALSPRWRALRLSVVDGAGSNTGRGHGAGPISARR